VNQDWVTSKRKNSGVTSEVPVFDGEKRKEPKKRGEEGRARNARA